MGSAEYFSSYEDLEIHKLMLEDKPRTDAYKNAILSNKSYFKDKIVMDVGCGTGILSVFCAQAGAKKVYAVEASNLANLAKEIVKENNYEGVIEVIHNKVENVLLPENIKVDVIVSEWMGFYLLHEGMLDSVLIARDKFLKEDGEMFPKDATIYVAPCSVPSLYKNYDDMYGVSMSTFAKHLRASKCNKPEIISVSSEDLLSPGICVFSIDLKNNKISDLDLFSIQNVVGASKCGVYQGLCIWFDCSFPNLKQDVSENPVILSTSPMSPMTHWKQTVIVLPEQQEVEESEPIAFQLDINRDKNICRRYNLQVTLLDPETTKHPLPCSCYMTKCILIKMFMQQNEDTTTDGIIEEDSSIGMEDEEIE